MKRNNAGIILLVVFLVAELMGCKTTGTESGNAKVVAEQTEQNQKSGVDVLSDITVEIVLINNTDVTSHIKIMNNETTVYNKQIAKTDRMPPIMDRIMAKMSSGSIAIYKDGKKYTVELKEGSKMLVVTSFEDGLEIYQYEEEVYFK